MADMPGHALWYVLQISIFDLSLMTATESSSLGPGFAAPDKS
jgi:hypothetical protein